ncbi:Acylphosphatase-like domain-containing protein [Lineolata rhizophorae]|uniref:Acylphosphatase n=1 Tax=Lineolata rhizophorae TaxID=578093 RepID=A0A6A6P1G1_9PEZI|nr:Acylphosphatase-like domain-containing protein [Lineolata rhizophorae]
MSQRISFKVKGKVQGVCFRAYAKEQARSLGVTGFVRNASDGTVVGEAQGKRDSLDKFVGFLKEGPPAARVAGVDQDELSVRDGERSFEQARTA